MVSWADVKLSIEKVSSRALDLSRTDWPEAWSRSRQLQAFVLGADPSNRSGHRFDHPFGLYDEDKGEKRQDGRYSAWLRTNLSVLGLTPEHVYVQNVVPFYLNCDTGKNLYWRQIARLCLPALIQELDEVDTSRRIPVLASCRQVFEILAAEPIRLEKTKFYYEECRSLDAEETVVGRRVFFFSRHRMYRLAINPVYTDFLTREIELVNSRNQ